MKKQHDLLESASALRWEVGERLHDHTLEAIYDEAARIA